MSTTTPPAGIHPHVNNDSGSLVASSQEEREACQRTAIEYGRIAVINHRIGLLQASTGSGKTRVLAYLAQWLIEQRKHGNKPTTVWIASPTIQVLSQHIMEAHTVGLNPKNLGILLGRQNFIHVRRLRLLLDELAREAPDRIDEIKNILAWVDAGCPPLGKTTKALAAVFPKFAYFGEDLAELTSLVAVKDCPLQAHNDQEPAWALHDEMNEQARRASIVYCTHAMLAQITRTIDPETQRLFTHLFIDEAHSLEESFANALGTDLSLLRLRSFLGEHKWGGELAKRVSAMMKALSNTFVPSDETLDPKDPYQEQLISQLRLFCKGTAKLLNTKKRADSTAWAKRLGRIAAAANKDNWLRVSHSPIRKYPSITSGPRSVFFSLRRIWDSAEAALLVSGTLYTFNKASGDENPHFIANKLAIPIERRMSFKPIRTNWAEKSLTVYHPKPDHAVPLCYPGTDDEVEPRDWWNEIAAIVLNQVHATAVGGTLVLCNSFRDVHGIAAPIIAKHGDLVVTGSGIDAKRRFVALAQEGRRPIWIACGAAWTGLDLNDPEKDADNDAILTDTVITRIPFGLNRTSTHLARKSFHKTPFVLEHTEALLRMQQGIGRAIRRPGVKNRRLWSLDGRMHIARPHNTYAAFANLFRNHIKIGF
jgi:ATP-dependent DNA helicase DinG